MHNKRKALFFSLIIIYQKLRKDMIAKNITVQDCSFSRAKRGGRDNIPPLACSVAGDFYSFDLASRGTALTLRLRDSFQPLTCGLSRKSRQFLHNARIGILSPRIYHSPRSRGSFCRRIAAVVCFCLPAGVSQPVHLTADFRRECRNVLSLSSSCYNDKNVYCL